MIDSTTSIHMINEFAFSVAQSLSVTTYQTYLYEAILIGQINYNHRRLRHSCWDQYKCGTSYEVRKFGRCTNLVNQIHQDQAMVKVSQGHPHIW